VVFLGLLGLSIAIGWLLWTLRPAAPGPLRLTKIAYSDLPGWQKSDPRPAVAAFLRSCAQISAQKPGDSMGGAGYAGRMSDWNAACDGARARFTNAAQARAFFEHWFGAVAVSAGDERDGLFTGYYEPQLNASRTQHGTFQTPVYSVPDDLVSVDLGAFRAKLHGEHIAGRVEKNRLVPYDARAAIDAKGLPRAHVLFYADDPVAVFFLHIQGSGRARFEDGTTERVIYAAQNGQPYTPIGHTLIARHALARENASLQSIRAWLRSHPTAAREVMETDASYVFFKEEPVGDPSLGAQGAQGAALTPNASLAVDPRLHAFGVPFYVSTTLPDGHSLRSLYIAQDIGGAIHGPVRADLFFGFGPAAEAIAGQMKQKGRLYALLPKACVDRLESQSDYPEP
jgi:membrane-bound lytic murein transglycosylase A